MAGMAWNVYRRVSGKLELIAKTRHAEDAAALVSLSGDVVKCNGRIVYTDLKDGNAAHSYDVAAALMHANRERHHRAELLRMGYAVSEVTP